LIDNEKLTFGKLIEGLRRAKLLTQDELAFCIGISRESMGLIERNIHRPSLENFIRLALNLGMQPSNLFKMVEDKDLLDSLYQETDEMAYLKNPDQ
jgi:DNA-binding XRE family transcriptional regulator